MDVPARDQVLECVAKLLEELSTLHTDVASALIEMAELARSKQSYDEIAPQVEKHRDGPAWNFALMLVCGNCYHVTIRY